MNNTEIIKTMPENEQSTKKNCTSLPLRIGKTTYLIRAFSADTATETLDDKVKKLIRNNIKNGDF